MKPLQQILREGVATDWGIGGCFDFETPVFISHDGISLIKSAPKRTQSIVERAQSYATSHDKRLLARYPLLGSGNEGAVYRIPIKNGLSAALKVYHEDHTSYIDGIGYFEGLLEARRRNLFDTLIPYLATSDFILTSLIPPRMPTYNRFVAKHPELERDVRQAFLLLQQATKLPTDVELERLPGDVEHKDTNEHIYVARFNPDGKTLSEKFRFFLIDLR